VASIVAAPRAGALSSSAAIVMSGGERHIDEAISEGWFSSFLNDNATVQVDFEGASFFVSAADGSLDDVYPACRAEFVADQRRKL
jgi:hypothetical protein